MATALREDTADHATESYMDLFELAVVAVQTFINESVSLGVMTL